MLKKLLIVALGLLIVQGNVVAKGAVEDLSSDELAAELAKRGGKSAGEVLEAAGQAASGALETAQRAFGSLRTKVINSTKSDVFVGFKGSGMLGSNDRLYTKIIAGKYANLWHTGDTVLVVMSAAVQEKKITGSYDTISITGDVKDIQIDAGLKK